MQWREIEDFPGYSVSNFGRVRNDLNDRILTLQRNQHGVVNLVSLGTVFSISVL